MAPVDSILTQTQRNWLIGFEPVCFQQALEQRLRELRSSRSRPTIFLLERDPVQFLAGFFAACTTSSTLVCCNPDWGTTEWQQVLRLIQPNYIWGELPSIAIPWRSDYSDHDLPAAWVPQDLDSLILIATGGSSGEIRFAMHTLDTLMAAVTGFQQHFQATVVNSICVLPLYHVSGLMQCLRSLVSGGHVCCANVKAIADGELPNLDPAHFFLSLVPTQLQRLLAQSPSQQWLAQVQTVLLGGAAAWPELLTSARHYQIALAPTYGMTETAAQIATLKPDEFLTGKSGCGQVLPHARVLICDASKSALATGQVGQVTIQASSLALGYYPSLFPDPSGFQPGDLGYLDAQGYLHITGRMNRVIHTGGKKVHPEEVEAVIRATGLVQDIYVSGLTDHYWGEVVSAVYVPHQEGAANPELLHQAVAEQLSRYKHPKYWLAVDQLPRNAQGKVNRAAIVTLLQQQRAHLTAATTASVLP